MSLREETLKEITKVFIGDNEKLFAYKSGPIIYDFFNQYFGFDDSYWDEEFKPSRWQMALNKLIIIAVFNESTDLRKSLSNIDWKWC